MCMKQLVYTSALSLYRELDINNIICCAARSPVTCDVHTTATLHSQGDQPTHLGFFLYHLLADWTEVMMLIDCPISRLEAER